MKFFAVLTSLVASASAIDVYLHTDNDCGSSWFRCNSINPNICCGVTPTFTNYGSVAARGIPTFWNVQLRGYRNGVCNSLQTIDPNWGSSFICSRANGYFTYTGVGYNFYGRKRAESEPAEECQRPNALGLPDGTEYDLTGLSDDELNALATSATNATTIADLPHSLQARQIL
ncbi:hypothetical protein QBC38DRAFT_459186 [Podospora fimiseda]|uniref:Ecp2 effector protein domain-containing protein n=1 Tax=Podospora fimiseda TaxID=252190 RepID=A0AAN7BHP0_9PEZI|nr:hypothetical protein QBC38DRAFT_459186 [Podospora fimiseda]